MTLKEQITADMKNAMKAHDTAKLSAIRLLLAAVKQREVDERVEPTDDLVIGVISKPVARFITRKRRHLTSIPKSSFSSVSVAALQERPSGS